MIQEVSSLASGKPSEPPNGITDKQTTSSTASPTFKQLTPEVLFESNPQPMWIYDLESLRFLAVNNAAVDIYGYGRDEFLSMTLKDIRPPEDVTRLEENVSEVSNGIDHAGSWRHIKKDGSLIDVEITSHTLTYSGRAAELVIAHDITHRHKIESQLRESEARFRSLFEHIASGIAVVSLEGDFIDVNPSFCELLGYSKNELLALNAKDVTHGEDFRLHSNLTAKLADKEIPHAWLEMRLVNKSGEPIWVRSSSVLVWGSSDTPLYLVTHVEDITEQKSAIEALRESQDRYRTVSELTTDLAYSFRVEDDGQLTAEWATGALNRITGFSNSEIKSRGGWKSLFLEEDLPVARRQTEALLKGHSGVAEYRIVTKDGDIRWLRDHARAAWDPVEMRTTHIFGALQDITDRKQADLKIKESQKTLLNILDSIDATIYVADMDSYEILFMNQHMKDIFGGNFEGQICHKAFRSEDKPCEHCNNDQLLDTDGKPTGVEIWEGQNPVTGRWYLNYDRAIIWLDGRYVRLQIATDITKIKQLEEERIRTEAQLRQSQKMEAVGTLAGGIAHDFNNILSAIIGFTELSLLELEDDSTVKQNLDQVYQAGTRARDMVKQILAFSRQSELERKPINIIPVVEEALKMLRGSLPATIDIRKELEEDPGIIEADPTQLHQVLMNLCTNSSHAMREEGGILEVRVEKVDFTADAEIPDTELRPGPYVKISVRDTGHGISKENLERIFDPYFSTKQKTEGTGLGLAVVQGIVKSHRGAITVTSSKGAGTTFNIYLPRVKAPAPKKSKKPNAIATGNEHILLVDDEQALVEIGKQLLTRLGYQAHVRTSSVEALELFQHDPQRFDLVISDMTMPNMTGDKLAREILKMRPDMPIILCTGYSERFTESQARDLGIKAFIMKPLVIGDLAATIRNVLDE